VKLGAKIYPEKLNGTKGLFLPMNAPFFGFVMDVRFT
jgi:hypothetical protein